MVIRNYDKGAVLGAANYTHTQFIATLKPYIPVVIYLISKTSKTIETSLCSDTLPDLVPSISEIQWIENKAFLSTTELTFKMAKRLH